MDVDKVEVDVIGGHAGTTIMPLLSQVPYRFRSTSVSVIPGVQLAPPFPRKFSGSLERMRTQPDVKLPFQDVYPFSQKQPKPRDHS